jgi:hypothetical protein
VNALTGEPPDTASRGRCSFEIWKGREDADNKWFGEPSCVRPRHGTVERNSNESRCLGELSADFSQCHEEPVRKWRSSGVLETVDVDAFVDVDVNV